MPIKIGMEKGKYQKENDVKMLLICPIAKCFTNIYWIPTNNKEKVLFRKRTMLNWGQQPSAYFSQKFQARQNEFFCDKFGSVELSLV